MHFHRSFEFYLQISGSAVVTVDQKEYLLSPGKAVLIFPYQYHSYSCASQSEYKMCIFSTQFVPDFHSDTNEVPTDNSFSFSWDESTDTSNRLLCRALACRICGEFEKDREYAKRQADLLSDNLLPVLVYANKNFTSKCLLREAVAEIGYDYAYISKLFKKR